MADAGSAAVLEICVEFDGVLLRKFLLLPDEKSGFTTIKDERNFSSSDLLKGVSIEIVD